MLEQPLPPRRFRRALELVRPVLLKAALRLGSAQAARGIGAERRDHRFGRRAWWGAVAEVRDGAVLSCWLRLDVGGRRLMQVHGDNLMRSLALHMHGGRRHSGRPAGHGRKSLLLIAVCALDETHQLIRIDQRAGANPEQRECAGDVPVRQRAVLGWPPQAPCDERDRGRKDVERAGRLPAARLPPATSSWRPPMRRGRRSAASANAIIGPNASALPGRVLRFPLFGRR